MNGHFVGLDNWFKIYLDTLGFGVSIKESKEK